MFLAVIGSQSTNEPVENECLMSRRRNGQVDALEMHIKASPIDVDGEKFTVVSMRDISAEKRRDALERIFLHDIANTLGTLLLRAELLATRAPVMRARATARLEPP